MKGRSEYLGGHRVREEIEADGAAELGRERPGGDDDLRRVGDGLVRPPLLIVRRQFQRLSAAPTLDTHSSNAHSHLSPFRAFLSLSKTITPDVDGISAPSPPPAASKQKIDRIDVSTFSLRDSPNMNSFGVGSFFELK